MEDTQVTWPYTLRTKSPMRMSQEHRSGCLHKDVNTATVPCVTRRIMEVFFCGCPGWGWVALWSRQNARVANKDIKVLYYVLDT